MKTGQLFWGILFLTIGGLFLLDKYNIIVSNWSFVWDLWPLILIFWGLAVILKGSKIKPIIAILFGLLIGVVVYGSLSNLFGCIIIDDYNDYDSWEVRTFTKEYDSTISKAQLEVGAGAGTFIIKRTTDELVKGLAKGSFADYSFYSSVDDEKAFVEFEMEKGTFDIFGRDIKNRLEIQLNEKPEWDLNLKIGAAKIIFDLSDFHINDLELKTGATNTRLKFGDKSDETTVNIEMGAASIEILVPKTSGCKITGDMVLVAKDINGFDKRKRDGSYYITENYENADKKIFININGGVSSLEVKRY